VLANQVVNRAGVSMIYRLALETSAPGVEIAAAHFAAWEIFELQPIVAAVNALEGTLSVERQLATYLGCRQLAERATRLLIRNRPNPFSAADALADLREPVAEAIDVLDDHLLGTDRQNYEIDMADLTAAGVDEELARRLAGLAPSVAVLDIVDVARESGRSVAEVSATHFAVADRLDLTWLRDRILALPRDSQWATLARLTLRMDLYADHRHLTSLVTASADGEHEDSDRQSGNGISPLLGAEQLLDRWMTSNKSAVDRYRQTMVDIRTTSPEIGVLLVGAREVRNLITRTSATNNSGS